MKILIKKKYVLSKYILKLLCGTLQKTTSAPKVSTVKKKETSNNSSTKTISSK